MIRTLVAHTMEIDDVDAAVSEILDQLGLTKSLLKNAVGIISCYSEFIESGVVKALCESLPFEVVGTTTLGNAAGDALGQMMLAISVLTSDDIAFVTARTETLAEKQEERLAEAYEAALAKLPGRSPSMMLSFMPLVYNVGGDTIVGILDRVSGGVPNFGTVTVDHTLDYQTAAVIHNGESFTKNLSMVLLEGDIHPSFYVASISEGRVMKQKAIITASDGNLLKEVNGIPILRYMETIGLAKEGQIEGANAIPFIIDLGDGTKPIARAIYASTPEGYAVCGGNMPVGATLSVGSLEQDDVLKTTEQVVETMRRSGLTDGMLLYSCLSRNLALGVETELEMEKVRGSLAAAVPYHFGYSGGEICPVYDAQGKPVNRFHNDTIVACVF